MERVGDHTKVAYWALGLSVLCSGFSGIFVKQAGLSGPVSALYRVLISGVVIFPLWLAQAKPRPTIQDLRLMTLSGGIFAVEMALWNTSLRLIPAATATLLANRAPLWLGLSGCFLFREPLSKTYWLGLALAMGGLTWLMGGDAIGHLGWDTGNLLAVGTGMLHGAYLHTIQRVRGRVALLTVMAISTLASLVVLIMLNLTMGSTLTGFSLRSWTALAGLGLISQLGGALGINYALGHLRAVPVSMLLQGQVVVTALLAMPLLGEYLEAHQFPGMALVLAGICCATQGTGKPCGSGKGG
jgi:drug/metabolite transporter (DMT)-like permease